MTELTSLPRRPRARRALLQAAWAGALALAGLLAGCDRLAPASKPAFKAIDVTGADYARGFTLQDPDGRARTLADYRGKIVVVFFGYTQCPDVCPTTLSELAEVKRALGPDGARVQAVFITVDPERDTAELLKSYVGHFGADFVGLRGTPEQVAETAKEFKVFYAKVPGKTETSYTVDHTAGSYVFDGRGRIRLFTRYGAGAQPLVSDLKILLAEPA